MIYWMSLISQKKKKKKKEKKEKKRKEKKSVYHSMIFITYIKKVSIFTSKKKKKGSY